MDMKGIMDDLEPLEQTVRELTGEKQDGRSEAASRLQVQSEVRMDGRPSRLDPRRQLH